MLLSMLLKPFVALIMLLPGRIVSEWLRHRMPNSRLKRFLLLPIPGHRR